MNLNREILRLSVPSILANITVPLVGMVDIAVVGHLGGEAAVLIGGISIGSMLYQWILWGVIAFIITKAFYNKLEKGPMTVDED